MARRKQHDSESADAAYRRLATEIEDQMKVLADALATHRTRQQARSTNWGFVGDLGYVQGVLAGLVEFLPRDSK